MTESNIHSDALHLFPPWMLEKRRSGVFSLDEWQSLQACMSGAIHIWTMYNFGTAHLHDHFSEQITQELTVV
jgi:hypothetical protein